jgi:hypothetical protein
MLMTDETLVLAILCALMAALFTPAAHEIIKLFLALVRSAE